jgi:hypothetical protein
MNRDRLQETSDHELVFLPDEFDAAIVGSATRAATPVLPVYGWKQCCTLFGDETGKKISALFDHDVFPSPLILMPIADRQRYWEQVRRGHIARWEQMDAAIIGVGRRRWNPEVAVYSRPAVLHRLAFLQRPSVGSPKEAAEKFFNDAMASVWMGDTTPFFFDPLK